MSLISIIVPVYNVEKYLKRCLDSLINQTYKNIEIILVNDGSKDNSLKILKEYQKKDDRIIIIDKINEGVSVARNTGIKAASGKYIGFVDPDDWIENNMYENMLNTIEKYDCNIAFCNYSKDSKIKITKKTLKIKKNVLGKLDIINDLICNMVGVNDFPKYHYVMGCVWRCLYKKSFIDQYNLRFIPKITIMEDLLFTIEALIYCDKVCIDRGFYYHYMKNKSSSLHKYNKKMWMDQVKVHNILENLIKEADLDEIMQNRLDSRYIAMAACAVNNEMKKNDAKLKYKINNIKYIFKDEKLKEVLRRSKNYNKENFKDIIKSDEKHYIEKENKIIKRLLQLSDISSDKTK